MALGLRRLGGDDWGYVVSISFVFTGWMEAVKLVRWSAEEGGTRYGNSGSDGSAFSPQVQHFFDSIAAARRRKEEAGAAEGKSHEKDALLASAGTAAKGWGSIQSLS